MAYVTTGVTDEYSVYLTPYGKELLTRQNNGDIKIKYFSISDSDIYYSSNTITQLQIPDISGDNDGCIDSLNGCYYYLPTIYKDATNNQSEIGNFNFQNLSENCRDGYVYFVLDFTPYTQQAGISLNLCNINILYNPSPLSFSTNIANGTINIEYTLFLNEFIQSITNTLRPRNLASNATVSYYERSGNLVAFYISKDYLLGCDLCDTSVSISTNRRNSGVAIANNLNCCEVDLIEDEVDFTNNNFCQSCNDDNSVEIIVQLNRNSNAGTGVSDFVKIPQGTSMLILPISGNCSQYSSNVIPNLPRNTVVYDSLEEWIDWYVDYFNSGEFLIDLNLRNGNFTFNSTSEDYRFFYPYTFFKIDKLDNNKLLFKMDLNFWYNQFYRGQILAPYGSNNAISNFELNPNSICNNLNFCIYRNNNSVISFDVISVKGLECCNIENFDQNVVLDCYPFYYYDLYLNETFNVSLEDVNNDLNPCDKETYNQCN